MCCYLLHVASRPTIDMQPLIESSIDSGSGGREVLFAFGHDSSFGQWSSAQGRERLCTALEPRRVQAP
jgi:hypothetical protein